jgi:hypothetical protein
MLNVEWTRELRRRLHSTFNIEHSTFSIWVSWNGSSALVR